MEMIIANPVNDLARPANGPNRDRSPDNYRDSSEFKDIVADAAKKLEEGKKREEGTGDRKQDKKDDEKEDSTSSSKQIGLIALNVSKLSLSEDIKMGEEIAPDMDNNKPAQSLNTKEELSNHSNMLSIIDKISGIEKGGDIEDYKAVSLIKTADKEEKKDNKESVTNKDISGIITEKDRDNSELIKPFSNIKDASNLNIDKDEKIINAIIKSQRHKTEQQESLTSHNEKERYLETSQTTDMVNNKIVHQEKTDAVNHTISKSEIFDQILKNTTHFIKKDSNSVTISLKPEHLGKLQIEISEKDNLIKATIVTENLIIKEIIESNQSSLKNALAQNGLSINYFSVLVDQHGKEPDSGKRDRFLNKIGQFKNSSRDKYEKELISNEIRINMNNGVNIFI
ncbi:MAG: flagellar hook-length control protein FliK [Nitrospirota bacterium]